MPSSTGTLQRGDRVYWKRAQSFATITFADDAHYATVVVDGYACSDSAPWIELKWAPLVKPEDAIPS